MIADSCGRLDTLLWCGSFERVEDFTAVIFQHEIDTLMGFFILIIWRSIVLLHKHLLFSHSPYAYTCFSLLFLPLFSYPFCPK
jgi:hypothetical protein